MRRADAPVAYVFAFEGRSAIAQRAHHLVSELMPAVLAGRIGAWDIEERRRRSDDDAAYVSGRRIRYTFAIRKLEVELGQCRYLGLETGSFVLTATALRQALRRLRVSE